MAIDTIVQTLQAEIKKYTPPLIDLIIIEFGHDPYLILIACLLSLRVKDVTTIHVCRDLFSRVKTPTELLGLPVEELERIIFRTGFYRNKAKVLRFVSAELLSRFDGKVPDTQQDLLSITGIGLKTAHLVLAAAFYKPAICVDTHVHRISNRLGLIKTTTVEESEAALRGVLAKKYWSLWNNLLVVWGQNICVPISPKCSDCPIKNSCKRVGVTKSR